MLYRSAPILALGVPLVGRPLLAATGDARNLPYPGQEARASLHVPEDARECPMCNPKAERPSASSTTPSQLMECSVEVDRWAERRSSWTCPCARAGEGEMGRCLESLPDAATSSWASPAVRDREREPDPAPLPRHPWRQGHALVNPAVLNTKSWVKLCLEGPSCRFADLAGPPAARSGWAAQSMAAPADGIRGPGRDGEQVQMVS